MIAILMPSSPIRSRAVCVTPTADDTRSRLHSGPEDTMARRKIVVAMMMHETNTFSPVPTPLVPIAVGLDFHAQMTAAMIDNATVVTGYCTYPHIDMATTAQRAARTL